MQECWGQAGAACGAGCQQAHTVKHALEFCAHALAADLVRQRFPHLLVWKRGGAVNDRAT